MDKYTPDQGNPLYTRLDLEALGKALDIVDVDMEAECDENGVPEFSYALPALILDAATNWLEYCTQTQLGKVVSVVTVDGPDELGADAQGLREVCLALTERQILALGNIVMLGLIHSPEQIPEDSQPANEAWHKLHRWIINAGIGD